MFAKNLKQRRGGGIRHRKEGKKEKGKGQEGGGKVSSFD